MDNERYTTEFLEEIAEITREAFPEYEIRSVYRITEETPAGPKVSHKEERFGTLPTGNIYGGIIMACPGTDRTNGEAIVEISTRDKSISMLDTHTPSERLSRIQTALQKRGHFFNLRL